VHSARYGLLTITRYINLLTYFRCKAKTSINRTLFWLLILINSCQPDETFHSIKVNLSRAPCKQTTSTYHSLRTMMMASETAAMEEERVLLSWMVEVLMAGWTTESGLQWMVEILAELEVTASTAVEDRITVLTSTSTSDLMATHVT